MLVIRGAYIRGGLTFGILRYVKRKEKERDETLPPPYPFKYTTDLMITKKQKYGMKSKKIWAYKWT